MEIYCWNIKQNIMTNDNAIILRQNTQKTLKVYIKKYVPKCSYIMELKNSLLF